MSDEIKWHDADHHCPPQGTYLRVRLKTVLDGRPGLPIAEVSNALCGQLGSLGKNFHCETVVLVGVHAFRMCEISDWAFMDPADEKILG